MTDEGAHQTAVVRRARLADIGGICEALKASWHFAHDDVMGAERAATRGASIYSPFAIANMTALAAIRRRGCLNAGGRCRTRDRGHRPWRRSGAEGDRPLHALRASAMALARHRLG